VKVLLTAENGRVWDMELSTACKFPEPKWTILGTYGTIISDGSTSQVEFFDPAQVPPMEATEVPSAQRRYDNDDVLPWQSMELSAADAPKIGDFYDNFWAVLREGAKMVVKPEETLEVVRIIEACRRVSAFYK
jgi:predicted dehydrogenase